MKKIIVKILKKMLPGFLKTRILFKVENRKNKQFLTNLKHNILSYYQGEILEEEKNKIINYLKNNALAVFPYEFSKKYSKEEIEVFTDESNDLKYVMHELKRLYFKRSMSEQSIKSLYHGLQLDQDQESPHLYLTEDFNVTPIDVIADIGAAEGNFSLSNIEKVKKAYLFECDLEWIEALEATFKPWKQKVQIINKYVTNTDSENTISMNTFYQSNPDITFFKVDIEGEEQNFLNACEPLFKSDISMKMAICTYHKHDDESDFTNQLKKWNFSVMPSQGYMIFIFDKMIKAPFLRKGLLRTEKKKEEND